ncbi:ABC-2 family transporter protein [Treponema bryantii]|uniref:ABC-2 family transporter protein n=1 Tax=Treponema bryantii TaxID=163 RepID=UPI002B2A77A9|nr:membrane protein [Treponema bryantii]
MNLKAIKTIVINSVQNTLLFKGSFFLMILTIFMSEIMSISIMLIILSQFHGFGDLTSGQFLFIYLFAHLSYSICSLFFNNLRHLGYYIQGGYFDRILLMPMNTISYVCCYNFDFAYVGQLITSLILFLFFANSFGIVWTFLNACIFILLLIGSVLVFASILLVLSTVAFTVIDWKPIDNIFGAFKEMLWYPTSIYNRLVRIILYSFVPLAYVVFEPTQIFYKVCANFRQYYYIPLIFVFVAIGLFIFSYRVWNLRSKYYQSVG